MLLTIFGSTGDLAYRKLYPALFNLYAKDYLNEKFAVIGTARHSWTNDHYREVVFNAVRDAGHDNTRTNADTIRQFTSHFYYQIHDVTNESQYFKLNDLSRKLDQKYDLGGEQLYYLAVAPHLFGEIAVHLKEQGLLNNNGYNRLIIEKPFGRDYQSAKKLNDDVSTAFDEQQIFRIDHYLGKTPVQSIGALRFANPILSKIWNKDYIDNIQITLSESLGVEERAGYYETAGAMRDMLQNHILQLVALITMEKPEKYNADEVSIEKIKALNNIGMLSEEDVKNNFVRGQYGPDSFHTSTGYREEDGTDTNSATETFVAGKLITYNSSLHGVPIYIRTGKRLAEKTSRIDVVLKKEGNIFSEHSDYIDNNVLSIYIDPLQGYELKLNIKAPGKDYDIDTEHLNYRINDKSSSLLSEDYETLVYDAINGDKTNFAHWEEVSQSWKLVDIIRQVWDNEEPIYPNYESGSMGPESSKKLLSKDGRQWEFDPISRNDSFNK